MNPALLLAATLALAPADRMQLADKMFAKGLYSEAVREYRAIGGAKTVSADDLAFRIAECEHALGNAQAAESAYAALLPKDLPKAMRAVVLYRLACARNDAALFLECERADPQGRYAAYARLRRALLLSKSPEAAKRREATGLFFELSASEVPSVAEESLYAAATLAYGDKRWSEAAILFGRLVRKYPDGARAKSARVPLAWSAYLSGRLRECLAACGDGGDDDLDYLRGAALMAMDNRADGLPALRNYLEKHPAGRYRSAAEVPVRRAEFDEAVKSGDRSAAVQAARQAALASRSAADALRLAWAHEKAGAMAEARAEYRRIAATWPDDPAAGEALYANALADLREQRWGAGELALDELCRRFPGFSRRSEALYWRGVAALQLGHEAEGAERLEAALKAGLPLDLSREARMLLADAEARAGNTAAASKRYAEIMLAGAADRMGAERLAAVVKMLSQSGEHKAALAGAKALAARTSDPAFAQMAAAREGEALEALGRSDEAVAAYRRALALEADTDEAAAAALALGILEYRKGELDAAEKTLSDAVARNAGASGIKARAEAYRNLARVCRAKGDGKKADGYETVVRELFGE